MLNKILSVGYFSVIIFHNILATEEIKIENTNKVVKFSEVDGKFTQDLTEQQKKEMSASFYELEDVDSMYYTYLLEKNKKRNLLQKKKGFYPLEFEGK